MSGRCGYSEYHGAGAGVTHARDFSIYRIDYKLAMEDALWTIYHEAVADLPEEI